MKVVYRRYASLYFIVGAEAEEDVRVLSWLACVPCSRAISRRVQNELGILEFIHCLVETLDKYFQNVCELDIMFNIDKAHFILSECEASTGYVPPLPCMRSSVPPADEMVMNGKVVETNKANIMKPVLLMQKASK